MASQQFIERLLIVRRIFADRGVRTASGLHTENAILRQRTASREEFGIFFGKNIVSHDGEAVPISQPAAERLDQSCLAGSYRPTDANHPNMFRARRGDTDAATVMFIGPMHTTS